VALLRYLADPASDARTAALLRSRFIRLSDTGLHRLGAGLAGALTGHQAPAAMAALGAEDQRVLTLARASVARWRELVDRLPPAELLDRILAEGAYAFELRGPRRLQARENLKKFRAIVRRVQNRGFATLARLADYLDRMSAARKPAWSTPWMPSATTVRPKGSKSPVASRQSRASERPCPVPCVADDGASVSVGEWTDMT
jgi:ATP-dependent exoDNAse (exonuclease V) beta subunit